MPETQFQRVRNYNEINCAVRAECFFEYKEKNAGDAGIVEAFDAVIGKTGKRNVIGYFVAVP